MIFELGNVENISWRKIIYQLNFFFNSTEIIRVNLKILVKLLKFSAKYSKIGTQEYQNFQIIRNNLKHNFLIFFNFELRILWFNFEIFSLPPPSPHLFFDHTSIVLRWKKYEDDFRGIYVKIQKISNKNLSRIGKLWVKTLSKCMTMIKAGSN